MIKELNKRNRKSKRNAKFVKLKVYNYFFALDAKNLIIAAKTIKGKTENNTSFNALKIQNRKQKRRFLQNTNRCIILQS